ncbi:RNA-directed DNA polymerase from mobile element jockey [Dissostichus eleginoides]|uniref:RNA-directed DNA polymerase from mobile element jockey n=1 Tax=Dissostichus eleginoides TaxID=100907 RepID=A0AAD9CVP4_DISEL|nr:RNA-directed DNA polymerase from mobile element jockey [Dissostichus eleginoides]KAK1906821.1 RNA-directed DNA polymerase from mobile element jockey [Dissostichus eleginoides]
MLVSAPIIWHGRMQSFALVSGKSTKTDSEFSSCAVNMGSASQTLGSSSQCWQAGAFPSDMKDGKIITLYKNKGDKGDCNNYRGILQLSVLGKVFSRILLVRLQKLAARVYPESQCGFRSGRSTTDMVFTVRQAQEKCREHNKPLHMAFDDLTKAFDMVSREGLFAILQKLGCPTDTARAGQIASRGHVSNGFL